MEEQKKYYCPECGTALKQGEINRINSGIDIACHICGTEIKGSYLATQVGKEIEPVGNQDDLGNKIKTGIQTIVRKIKEFAEELDGDKSSTNNDYSED